MQDSPAKVLFNTTLRKHSTNRESLLVSITSLGHDHPSTPREIEICFTRIYGDFMEVVIWGKYSDENLSNRKLETTVFTSL